ncbi:hypothetical protein JR316_0007655 [Psilocybe cubensis]|uniref:Uncharacterized protein n=1 Tax=Psilocybe cubensis TaxID=181762 RepID=A0ACB8GUH2_PSICU|nr:hypothetical protein JR316_0007655 [Psilocybe cubensis]KAH9479077.1 hypothetical protein JR316_0007655 [Psilocybe cubensis]
MSEVLTPSELELAEAKSKRISNWVSQTRQHSPVNAFSPPTPPPTVIESKRIRSHTHSPHHRLPLVILDPTIMSNTVYSRHTIPSTDPRMSGYHSPPMAYPSSPSYPHQSSTMPGPMIPPSAPFNQQSLQSPIYPGNMFSHPSGMVPSGGYGQTGISPGMQPNHEFASLGRDETGSIIAEPVPPMSAPAGTGSGPHTLPGQMPNPNVIVMDDSPGSNRDKDVPLADDERAIPPDYVPASPGPDSRSHESSSLPARSRARPNGNTATNPTNSSQNAPPANPLANTNLGANPLVQAAEVAAANYVQGHGHGHKHKHGLKHEIGQAALDAVVGGVSGQAHTGAGNAAGSSVAPPLMHAAESGLAGYASHAGAGNVGSSNVAPLVQAAESALTGYAHGQGQSMQTQLQGGSHQRAPILNSSSGHHHHHHHHGHDRDHDRDHHHHHGHGHGHGHHRSSSHPHSHSHHHHRHPTVYSRDFATYSPASPTGVPATTVAPVTSSSRPVFSRHRSRSIDDRDLQRSMARTRARYDDGAGAGGTGGYGIGVYGGTHGGYTTGSGNAGYPIGTSGSQGVYGGTNGNGVGNNGSYPQTIYPSSTQPTVVPVNDGKGGWVIVPPPGKNLHIVDSHNRTLYHSGGHGASTQVHPNKLRARSSSQPRAAAVPSQSFFSKFFGVGRRNGVSRERGRARMVQPQPVQKSLVPVQSVARLMAL